MKCEFCEKQIDNNGTKFCRHCGNTVPRSDAESLPGQEEEVYGGFWPRLGAFMVDVVIVMLIGILIVILWGAWSEEWDNVVGWASLIVYTTLFLAAYSTTPGKKLFGLKVIDAKTRSNLSFGKSLIRSLSYIVSSLFLGIGFLVIVFNKRKRGWHDSISNTVVIQQDYNKTRAIILAILASVFVSFVFYVYSENGEYTDPIIRSGVRQIENQTFLNPGLFKTKESTPQDVSSLDAGLERELSAIVAVLCPIDNSDEEVQGSGTILTEDGIILTNYHVIEETTQPFCAIGITNDISQDPEYIYYARLMLDDQGEKINSVNRELDIAFLQIVEVKEGYTFPEKFPFVSTIGSSDALNFNEKIYIVGYPGFGGGTITYTSGVMSGKLGDDLIKTSAKIDFGNSGGAAFNERGEFIGIPTFILKGKFEGLGYIIGIDSVKDWISDKDWISESDRNFSN